ncbi:MAG: hypothetical protein HC930_08965, partial [Hydrococcus sp. SU_1_0]|nr:hypothetical protein [Hydrococcus sp. SU_1_0]
KVLHAEGKYHHPEITPVYIGGIGSKLLNWLAIGGIFDRHCEVNELFSRMLSKASGFEDTKELTRLSTRPQDEIACGLVLNATRLEESNNKQSKLLIAGEDCFLNDKQINWQQCLPPKKTIERFDISRLVQLSKFFDEFNLALKELDIEGLFPYQLLKAAVLNLAIMTDYGAILKKN